MIVAIIVVNDWKASAVGYSPVPNALWGLFMTAMCLPSSKRSFIVLLYDQNILYVVKIEF